MSEYTYTQQDLVRARKFDLTLHQGRADIIHCACVTDEALAILIASVRAEARQAPNLSERECQVCGEKLPKASSFSVHNGKCRRTGSRLAAAENLKKACQASVRLLGLIRHDGYAGDFLPELDRFIDDDERDNEPNGALAAWEAAK